MNKNKKEDKNKMDKIYFSPMANNLETEVKIAMVDGDICHREKEFTDLLQNVRKRILNIVKGEESNHTVIMLTGSGTAAVESIISSIPKRKIMIIDNGHYGRRIRSICDNYNLSYHAMVFMEDYDIFTIEKELRENEEIKYVAMVHHETSTGMLNPLRKIGQICKKYKKKLIVDAISSIVVHDINMELDNISFLAGSSNKGIAGPEGLSFVIAKKDDLLNLNESKSYYLSLKRNFNMQEKGQTPFTPAVRIFMGLRAALNQLEKEGIENRQKRFAEIAFNLRKGMKELGFNQLTTSLSNVCTLYDIGKYNYDELHKKIKEKGFVIYTGNDNNKTFRLCTFGNLTMANINNFLKILHQVINEIDEVVK